MIYRTRLNEEQIALVKEMWYEGHNNTHIARVLKAKYSRPKDVENYRKRIRNLTTQLEEELHRGNAINEYAQQEETLGRAVKHVRHKTELADGSKISTFIKNPNYEDELDDLKEEIIEEMKVYAPKYPTIKRQASQEDHLLVVSLTDLHIGKLCSPFATGDEYNVEIAIQRAKEGVEGLLHKTSGFNIDRIMLIGGHDVLHIDTPRNTTTAGTFQDVDGVRYENFIKARKMYCDIIEMLLSVADVSFYYCPSNHDWTNGFFLCQTVEARFKNCKNITFEVDLRHRKYFQYGRNLIGVSHGDGAKEKNLGMLMSVEASQYWGETNHRYFYLGHVHHRVANEYVNCTVEYTRSPSGTDRRHSDNGYVASKAIEGYIHCKTFGQIAKFTHLFI